MSLKRIAFSLAKMIYLIIFILGIFLLSLNVIGLFRSLRHPDVYTELDYFENDITIDENRFYEIISEKEPSDKAYTIKVNQAVNSAIAHYWAGPSQYIENADDVKKYHLEIPIYENFLLYFLYKLIDGIDPRYEFCDYQKAVERGVGLCSQEALILDAVLDERGIQSRIILYPELHVVNTAMVDSTTGSWWVFDPDYGVVIEHDIQEILHTPEIVRPYYAEAGYDSELIDYLIYIYSTEYLIRDSVQNYLGPARCQIEEISYLLIWIIPVFLIIIGASPYIWGRMRKQKERN